MLFYILNNRIYCWNPTYRKCSSNSINQSKSACSREVKAGLRISEATNLSAKADGIPNLSDLSPLLSSVLEIGHLHIYSRLWRHPAAKVEWAGTHKLWQTTCRCGKNFPSARLQPPHEHDAENGRGKGRGRPLTNRQIERHTDRRTEW